ncbi:hypothetical protein BUALT_Bualt12G0049700 [Buddleja alternifolia]|uniref:Uncharacterized protein n=1 Tax=Buddleja alternifolia TaxID=168488 RepID=A0AAV6WZF1_9LAMI|nr:hypothetical protein BUALT_Bualt12G0049700 [Buddleja alternifolia]
MGLLRSKSVMCPVDEHCSEWARRYMDYCLCSGRDGVSLALGIISIVSWVVAEIPQIITSYNQKSTQGLSVVFLLTWILGDLLNLSGCLLEPATLPTQYYTALLYTVTTLLLSSQAVYYGHIYPRLKSNKRRNEAKQAGAVEKKRDQNHGVDPEKANNVERSEDAPSTPIPFPGSSINSSNGELYFMSARSLSVSHSPSVGSFLSQRTPTANAEQNSIEEPLLGEVRSPQSQSPPKVKTMLCVATRASSQETLAAETSGIGSFLGWGMAAIYLCGRLPQIWLNVTIDIKLEGDMLMMDILWSVYMHARGGGFNKSRDDPVIA